MVINYMIYCYWKPQNSFVWRICNISIMVTEMPIVTLVISFLSIIVVFGSGITRRLLSNVEETKRIQKEISAYNKELRGSIMKKDKVLEAKLKKRQPHIKQMQAKVAKDRIRPKFAFLVPLLIMWTLILPAILGSDWLSIRAAISPIPLNFIPYITVTQESTNEQGVVVNTMSVFGWYILSSFAFQASISKMLKLT